MSFISRSSIFVRRATLWIGSIIGCVMLVMTLTIITLAEETNRTAARQQMHRLQMAVEGELKKARIELALVASGQPMKTASFGGNAGIDPFSENLEAAWLYFNFDEIYAIDRRRNIVTGSERGAPAGALTFASLQPLVSHLVETVVGNRTTENPDDQQKLASPEYENVNGASGLIPFGKGLAVAAVVPFNPARSGADDKHILIGPRATAGRAAGSDRSSGKVS